MKKAILICFLVSLLHVTVEAQDYLSTSFLDQREINVISQFDLSGNVIQETQFPLLNPGSEPFRWVESNGSIYGICSDGGLFGRGLIFEYDYENNDYSVVADLTNFVSVIVPLGDSLFGIQQDSIFTLDITSGIVQNKVAATGLSSLEHLMLASNGLLYGTADNGGANGDGGIFSFDPQAQTFQILHSFSSSVDGRSVNALTEGNNGILYGSNTRGGSDFGGTLYSFNTVDNSLTVLQEFLSGSNIGFDPESELVLSDDEKLYGVFRRNDDLRDGIIFQYDLSTNSLNTWPLDELTTGGGSSFTPYLRNSNELIYATSYGGVTENGAIVSLDITTGQFTVLEDFELFFGATDRFIESSTGDLLGLSEERVDSEIESGAIFSYGLTSDLLEVKIRTQDFIAGAFPFGPVLESIDQTFVGLSNYGGEFDFGTIYEYLPAQDTIVNRVSFGGGDITEWISTGALSEEINGFHYGLAELNDSDFDVLYRFDPSTNTLDTVHTFSLNSTGTGARGQLVHQNGMLYGEVNRGGANGLGGLFSYNISQDTYSLIYSFEAGIAGSDVSSLVINEDKLYGTRGFDFRNDGISTSRVIGSPNERGVLFQYDLTNNTFTTLKTFLDGSGEDDIYQFFGPLNHSNGRIYFYGAFGGSNGIGGLLELDPSNNNTLEFDFFDPNNTVAPSGLPRSLLEDENGLILGQFDILDNNLSPRESYGIFTFDPDNGAFNELSALRYPGRSIGLTESCIDPYARNQNNIVEVCPGDGLEIIIDSPNTGDYTWAKDGTTISGENSPILDLGAAEASDAGTYKVTLINACGSIEIVVQVSVKEVISEIMIGSVSCNGLNDGSVTINQTTGGTAPFEYSLDGLDYQAATGFNNLSPGNYILYSRDSIGCVGTQTFVVEEPQPLSIDASFDGVEVMVIATGGTEPYTFSSDGIDFQQSDRFLLANGEYTFTVRDTNGCEAIDTETLLVTSVDIRQKDIQVYPNPVRDVLRLRGVQDALVKVIDSKGIVVLDYLVPSSEAQLSLQFLKPGIYILEIGDTANEFSRFRLVKD